MRLQTKGLLSHVPIREMFSGQYYQFEVLQAFYELFVLADNVSFDEKESLKLILSQGSLSERNGIILKQQKEWIEKWKPGGWKEGIKEDSGELINRVRETLEDWVKIQSELSISDLSQKFSEFDFSSLHVFWSLLDDPPDCIKALPVYREGNSSVTLKASETKESCPVKFKKSTPRQKEKVEHILNNSPTLQEFKKHFDLTDDGWQKFKTSVNNNLLGYSLTNLNGRLLISKEQDAD